VKKQESMEESKGNSGQDTLYTAGIYNLPEAAPQKHNQVFLLRNKERT
jgi:hypothetical protein